MRMAIDEFPEFKQLPNKWNVRDGIMPLAYFGKAWETSECIPEKGIHQGETT
jgi:hypothetical protein